MTANATHPGRVTIPGTDVGVKGTLVAEPQTENMLLSLDDRLALGPVKVDTNPSGTLETPGLVVPIVSGVLWLLRFEPHRHDVPPFVMGVYNLNTSGVDLKDLVVVEVTGITETDRTNLAGAIAAAASINREAANGVAGLDSSGKLIESRIPATYGRRVVAGANYATEDTAALAAGVPLLLAPGTHTIAADLTIASPVVASAGTTFSVASTKTLTLSGVVAAPAVPIFAGAGTVKLSKTQSVYADWWGGKGTAAAPTSTIQKAISNTAQGTAILLAGKYWTTPIQVLANEDTLTGDLAKSLVGISSPGVRSQTAPTEWGAEIYLGNNQNADLLWLNGTQRANLQPSRSSFTLDNVNLNGNKANNATGGSALRLSFVKDVYIGRVLCESAKNRGMYVSAACNQVIGKHIEAMSNDDNGIDLASLGDSHFDILLGGANGKAGVILAGGTQVNQIHQYLNTTAGVNVTGDNCAIAMCRVNDNGQAGVVLSGTSSNTWIGRCYSVDNGTDTGQTTAIRSGVRITGAAYNNRIDYLSAPSASGTQQWGIRYDTSLTGANNSVGAYVGSANVLGDVSMAATVFTASNRVDMVNGSSAATGGTANASLLTPATISNSAAETTLWTDVNIPSAELVAGQVYRLRLAGNLDCQATSGTFIVRVKVNGITLKATTVAVSQTGAATNVPWQMDVDLYVDVAGTSGFVSEAGQSAIVTAASGTRGSDATQALGQAINLSGGFQITVTGIMATAAAANILRLNRATRNRAV